MYFIYILIPNHYTIKKAKVWTLNLVDNTGEIIATRKQGFKTKAEAETARDEIIAFANNIINPEKIYVVEHVLLRPRAVGDPVLPVCLNSDCSDCDEIVILTHSG